MADLRFRGEEPAGLVSSGGDSGSIGTLLRSIDAFPKYADSALALRKRTPVSLLAACALVVLFFSETLRYMGGELRESVGVDDSDPAPLWVTIDITVHGSHCDFVELHTVDQADRTEHSFAQHVAKFAISRTDGGSLNPHAGNGKNERPNSKFVSYCGSCSGRGRAAFSYLPGVRCCNTCASVAAANPENPGLAAGSEQCHRENLYKDYTTPQDCRIVGAFEIPKLSGNFHIGAPNTSHTVHVAGFGDDPVRVGRGALTGHAETVEAHHSGVFRYHLKVVPYSTDAVARRHHNYRYATTLSKDIKPVAGHGGNGGNGIFMGRKSTVFFVYDFSPYMVQVSHAYPGGLGHYIVQLCAVLGGVLAVARLADGLAFAVGGGRGAGIQDL